MRFRFSLIVYLICIPIFVLIGLYGVRKLHIARLIISQNRTEVTEVAADREIPGKVYAQVTCDSCGVDASPKIYESVDYGQHWQISEHSFTSPLQTKNDLYIDSGDLKYREKIVWVPPKPVFRTFFHDMQSGFQLFRSVGFQLHVGQSITPGGQNVIYAAMGLAGVLIGPNPPTSNVRPWQISHEGIDGILSPLSIRNPVTITTVIVFILLIPPLPILHAWLIGQAYRYIYPIDEADKALQLALKVSCVLTLPSAIAIFFWLTNENVDAPLILIVMSALVVALSVGTAVTLARRRDFSDWFTLRLAVGTGLLSLIVPFGSSFLFQHNEWLIILSLIIGFAFYRGAMSTYLNNQSARITLWQTDQMSIELLVIFLIILLPLCRLAYEPVFIYENYAFGILMLFLIPTISITLLALYANHRGKSLIIKKIGTLESNHHNSPLFGSAFWWFTLFRYTAYWLTCGLLVIGIVSFAQSLFFYWSVSFGG